MRLLNDFVNLLTIVATPSGFEATIELKKDHIIYRGHFPGYPVTPGVIQLQLVQELLEHYLKQNLKLKVLSQSKFLKVLNPIDTPLVIIKVKYVKAVDHYEATAQGDAGRETIFRLQAAYQFLPDNR